MSAQNTTIQYQTRYTINGTPWNATGGDIAYNSRLAIVSDSESLGGVKRKKGEFEAEVTVRGNLASDVNPFAAPQSINEGDAIPTVQIYVNGIGNPPAVFRGLVVDYFREIVGSGGGELSQPNTWELHGFTSDYTKA